MTRDTLTTAHLTAAAGSPCGATTAILGSLRGTSRVGPGPAAGPSPALPAGLATRWKGEQGGRPGGAARASPASEGNAEAVAASRTTAAEMLGGGDPQVQEWEVVAMHRVRDTPEDGAVRLIWARAEHGQLDRIVDAWRTTLPPQLERMPGFCSVSELADRDTARAVSAVDYESREAMNRSADQALTVRDRFAATLGFDITDVEEYDVVLAHLRIPEVV